MRLIGATISMLLKAFLLLNSILFTRHKYSQILNMQNASQEKVYVYKHTWLKINRIGRHLTNAVLYETSHQPEPYPRLGSPRSRSWANSWVQAIYLGCNPRKDR